MSDRVTRREARALDRALAGESAAGDAEGMLATASEVRAAFDLEVPVASHERAMFISGVSTRRHRLTPLRLLVPVTAFLLLVVLAYLGGRTALPGDSLYPVRKALGTVGLARTPIDEIDARIGKAGSLLSDADRALDSNPGTSLRLAVEALEELGPAIDLLDELEGNDLITRQVAIDALEGRAVDVIGAVARVGPEGSPVDRGGEDGDGSSGDDDRSGSNSGSGNDDDRGTSDDSGSGDEDNSGPGSTDDSSDSGSGGGDDDRSGSNSGSGSGSGDDNSGSGSGDDTSDPELPDLDEDREDVDDNSGSGSG